MGAGYPEGVWSSPERIDVVVLGGACGMWWRRETKTALGDLSGSSARRSPRAQITVKRIEGAPREVSPPWWRMGPWIDLGGFSLSLFFGPRRNINMIYL